MSQETKRQEVEQMGVFFEHSGFSPMVGRVFSFLLLAEPPHKSFDEIREFLQASKSAISTSLNTLMDRGLVHYITFSGDRKRYFRVNIHEFLEHSKNKIRSTAEINDLLERILKLRVDSDHRDFNKGLAEVLDFMRFFQTRSIQIIEDWEAQRKNTD